VACRATIHVRSVSSTSARHHCHSGRSVQVSRDSHLDATDPRNRNTLKMPRKAFPTCGKYAALAKVGTPGRSIIGDCFRETYSYIAS